MSWLSKFFERHRDLFFWTGGLLSTAFVWFILQPLQELVTPTIRKVMRLDPIVIAACSPLKSAILIVESRGATQIRIHSAEEFPVPQIVAARILNNSAKALTNVSVVVRAVNHDKQRALWSIFSTDSRLSGPNYKVEQGSDDNEYRIRVERMNPEEELSLNFLTMSPTTLVVEVDGSETYARKLVVPGECEFYPTIKKMEAQDFKILDSDAVEKNQTTAGNSPSFHVNDIVDPVGPISMAVLTEYNCGSGPAKSVSSIEKLMGACVEAKGSVRLVKSK